MSVPTDQVCEDFDRIALLTETHGGAGDTYHRHIERHLPPRCESALEVGCGTGSFTRLLAGRARNVVAIDVSPQMIRLARQHSASYPHVDYVLGDVLRLALPAESFDCIVSLATLHHLPMEEALLKMKGALKTNGVLVIHDLVADQGLVDGMRSALAYPLSVARRFRETGRLRQPREVREAWKEHGAGEAYLTLNEVREMCRRYLPGARIHRHLFWRYTVVWHKTAPSFSSSVRRRRE
jgi:ubiquinone/menaquinone biosynthesis C-methylase UbiE